MATSCLSEEVVSLVFCKVIQLGLGLVHISLVLIEPAVGLIGEHPVEVVNLFDGIPSDMEGIHVEDIGDDIADSAFEVCGDVLILVLELEAVFAPSVEELAVDVIDNLFEGILEVFCRRALEDAVLEVVADAEEDSFRGGIGEVVLGGLDAFWEVFSLVWEVVAHVCHGEGPEEFGEVIPLEHVEVIVIFVVIGGSVDLEVQLYEGIGQVIDRGDILFLDGNIF